MNPISIFVLTVALTLANCHPHPQESGRSIDTFAAQFQQELKSAKDAVVAFVKSEICEEIPTYFVHYGFTRSNPRRLVDLPLCSTKNACPDKPDFPCPPWMMLHFMLEYEQFVNTMDDIDTEIYATYYTQTFTIRNDTVMQKERLMFVTASSVSNSSTGDYDSQLKSPYEGFKLDFRTNEAPLFDESSRAFRVNFESPVEQGFKNVSIECNPKVNCEDEDIQALQKLGVEASKNSSDWMKVVIGTTGLKGAFDLGVTTAEGDSSVTYATFEIMEEGKLKEGWSPREMKKNIQELDKQWIKTCKCVLINKSKIAPERIAEKCFDESGTRDDLRKVLDISSCPESWSSRNED